MAHLRGMLVRESCELQHVVRHSHNISRLTYQHPKRSTPFPITKKGSPTLMVLAQVFLTRSTHEGLVFAASSVCAGAHAWYYRTRATRLRCCTENGSGGHKLHEKHINPVRGQLWVEAQDANSKGTSLHHAHPKPGCHTTFLRSTWCAVCGHQRPRPIGLHLQVGQYN